MFDPLWLFGMAGLLLIIVLARLLRQNPGDAERAWQRQEHFYRQRGLVTQRPDDWERIYRRSQVAFVLFVVVLAAIVVLFIMRIYAL